MRIGINATFRMHGGGMVHLRHLLRSWEQTGIASQHQIYVFTRRESIPALELQPGSKINTCPIQLDWTKLVWEQLSFPKLLSHYDLDVLFCPGGIVPFRSSVPRVMMLQNAAPFSRAITLRSAGASSYAYFRAFGALAQASARVSDRIIFISHTIREQFQNQFGIPAEKSEVIYHGRDTFAHSHQNSALLADLGIQSPYILSVSHLYPYKKIPALIEGYALAHPVLRRFGLRLVLAGKSISVRQDRLLRNIVAQRGLSDWVLFVGEVEHAKVATLLAECRFLAFQSTCENCPNTLIEALAAGIPIASSNASVMPEIAGDAAFYFDPFSPPSIARALTQLAKDDDCRAMLRALALQRANAFPTWAEVGRLTVDALAKATENSGCAAHIPMLPDRTPS
jgi:glycosyltransferase involved in cell wall biosynthesis